MQVQAKPPTVRRGGVQSFHRADENTNDPFANMKGKNVVASTSAAPALSPAKQLQAQKKQALVQWAKENPGATVQDGRDMLQKQFKSVLATNTISAALHGARSEAGLPARRKNRRTQAQMAPAKSDLDTARAIVEACRRMGISRVEINATDGSVHYSNLH